VKHTFRPELKDWVSDSWQVCEWMRGNSSARKQPVTVHSSLRMMMRTGMTLADAVVPASRHSWISEDPEWQQRKKSLGQKEITSWKTNALP
jgi:hypothetical protein